ncbi:MAG: NlpC/P60 family protein [Terrimesophilobacter sp.]
MLERGLHRVISSKAREAVAKLAVIAVSGGLVAALALPANAFNNSSQSVPNAAFAAAGDTSSVAEIAPAAEPLQEVAVSASIELSVTRDNYTATKPAPVRAAMVNRFLTLNPPAQSYSGGAVVQFGMQFVGIVPYGSGNSPTTSFSCDGFVQYVFGNFGISLPRTVNALASHFVAISPADAQPGDLLWWPGQHVGIYAGGGMLLDSPTWGRYVEYHRIWGNPVYMRLK